MEWPTHGTAPRFTSFQYKPPPGLSCPGGAIGETESLSARLADSGLWWVNARPNPLSLLSRGETLIGGVSGIDQRPQFHIGPIGVCVQQGPKPPPFQSPR
jgi:hypothetical protein